MRGKRRCVGSMAIMMAAAVMAAQTTALAEEDAMAELDQILEAQFSAETGSVVGDYLGMDTLKETFAANGGRVQVQLGLTEESSAVLEDTIPEAAYLNLVFAEDPNAKQWLLSLGAGLEDESLLDASLYGDESMLALSLPQFCSSALGIRAGSFLEQYDNSALKEFLGTGDLGIDDFNMSFYPEAAEASAEEGSLEAEFAENVQQAMDTFEESGFSMTKTETEGQAVYTATVETDAVMQLYGAIMEEYLDALDEMGILDLYATGTSSDYSTEDMDLEEVIDASLEELSAMMGEEGIMTFYVQDDLLQSVTYQIDVYETDNGSELDDGADLMAAGDDWAAPESETEVASGTQGTDITAEEPVGNIFLSFALDTPEQPDDAFTLDIQLETYETGDTATIRIRKQTERTDTLTEAAITVTAAQYDEILFDDTLYRISFDSATGELDLEAGVTDPDSGEYAGLKMTSVFHDVVPGSSFAWTVEQLSIVAEESFGLTGEISVQADPGTIEIPDTAMIFEADEDELNSLVMEIYMKAISWAEDFQNTWNEALGIEAETGDDWSDDGSSGDLYQYEDESDEDASLYEDETQTEAVTLDGASA